MTHTPICHLPLGGGWEGVYMMKYIKPFIQIEEAEAAQMLAESLAINSGKTVDGGDALTKENDDDIWNNNDDW